jgi:hypothetical protein
MTAPVLMPDCPYRDVGPYDDHARNGTCMAQDPTPGTNTRLPCKFLIDRELCPEGWR